MPEGFSILNQIGEPVLLKYEKDRNVIVRRLPDSRPEIISEAIELISLEGDNL